MATNRVVSEKSVDAYRTISEVAAELELPPHVLRFWESRFPQLRPLKRAGGRRFYRPADVTLLRDIRVLLHDQGYTIKGVQRLLRERAGREGSAPAASPAPELGRVVVDRNSSAAAEATAQAEAAAEPPPPSSRDAAASAGIAADTFRKSTSSAPASAHDRAALSAALALIEDCERRLREALAARG